MAMKAWDSAVERFFIRWRVKALMPFLDGKVLDIGCGANALIEAWGNGVGIDIYPWENVDAVMDACYLGMKAKSFDTIVLMAVLNHFPSLEARIVALTAAHFALRDEGRLVLSMISPFVGKIWHRLTFWDTDQKFRGMKDNESYGINRKDIIDLLNCSNFILCSEQSFEFGLNHIYIAKKSGQNCRLNTCL